MQCFGVSDASGEQAGKGTKTTSHQVEVDYNTISLDRSGFNLNQGLPNPYPLEAGRTLALQVGVLNAGWPGIYCCTDPATFSWKSSNPLVARVSSKGVVTPGSIGGKTTITATTARGRSWSIEIQRNISLSKAKIVLEKKTMAYTGKALKPKVKSVTLNGKKLNSKTDYTVKYENNKKIGKAIVTIIGKGYYADSVKTSFAIEPGKPKLSVSSNVKAKTMVATWNKIAGAKEYQMQWREQGGKWKTKTVKSTKTTVKGLASNKLYDFRVRAVVGSSKSAWSGQIHRWSTKQARVKAVSKKAGIVNVSWSKSAKANAGYLVVVRYSKNGNVAAKQVVAAGKTSAIVKGLKPGKTAWVEVSAQRKVGGTVYAGELTCTKSSIVKVAGKA